MQGGTPPFSYTIDMGNSVVVHSNSFTYRYRYPGSFTPRVTVTDWLGLSSSRQCDVITVLQPDPLRVEGSVSKTSGSVPLTVEFRAEISGGVPPYNYDWNFGDGTKSTVYQQSGTLSVTKYYTTLGTFSPWLSVTDFLGTRELVTLPTIETYRPLSFGCIVSPTTGPAPLYVTFETRVSGGVPPYHFIYVFDASSKEGSLLTTSVSASTTYTRPGLYEAFVMVYDSKAQRARAECGGAYGFITVTP